ncbi:MAG: hypothetical protein U9R54_04335 [Bacteroidota bacterium]|nr:hypothetical protein [Bacteroidota bacterium]
MINIVHLRAYKIINRIFAGIIITIILYSGIFSAQKSNHPIPSACTVIAGYSCKSTGLSRSFSEIVRFNFESARKYNSNGISVFLFFLIQLFMRLLSLLFIKMKFNIEKIVIIDISISILMFIYFFRNFLLFWQ